jgi:hypothetical protein
MMNIIQNINYDLNTKETISDKTGILRTVFLLIENKITLINHNAAAMYSIISLNDKVTV